MDRPFVLEGGGQLRDITVAFETWGTLADDGGNAILVCHALTGDAHAAGPAGAGAADSPAGGTRLIGPGPRHRHRPLLRGLRQRARRLPGLDRPGVASARTGASRTGPASRWCPSATWSAPRPARRRARHRAVAQRHRRLDGRHAGPRVGRDVPRPGRVARAHRHLRGRHRPADRLVEHRSTRHRARPRLARRRLLRRRAGRRTPRRAGAGPHDLADHLPLRRRLHRPVRA